MRKVFVVILLVVALFMGASVFVFHRYLHLSWLDAAYFTVTTMTTIGYGDINLSGAPPFVKVFGMGTMIGGATLMATVFGVITDYLVRSRFEEVFGFRGRKMRGHIILCGLGNVGIRVLEQLHRLGEQVIVIEKDEQGRFIEMGKTLKVPIIHGDMRAPGLLEQAHIMDAKAVIAAAQDDMANIEAALNARAVRPDIRVVVRIFDTNLARKLEGIFGFKSVFSTSALAAPGFAMAAIDPGVVSSFYVGDALMTNVELVVAKGSRLEGMSTEELRDLGDLSILSYVSAETGERRFHPSTPVTLREGDRIVVSTTQEHYLRVKRLCEV